MPTATAVEAEVAGILAAGLGFGSPADAADMAGYLLQMTPEEMIEYLDGVLGPGSAYTEEIKQVVGRSTPDPAVMSLPPNVTVYRKKPAQEDALVFGGGGRGGKGKQAKHRSGGVPQRPDHQLQVGSLSITKARGRDGSSPAGSPRSSRRAAPSAAAAEPAACVSKRKHSRASYVSLYSVEGAGKVSSLLPGRIECGCCATKHKLINNCLGCGRIVCSQEGVGPCMFCGELVATAADQEVLLRGSKKSEQLRKKLLKDANQQDELAKARERKDRLLHYQNTGARRMRVIDDESDYFSHDSNKWLSAEAKEKLKKREAELRDKKERARRQMTIQIDFAGRKITEYDASQDVGDMYADPDEANDESERGAPAAGAAGPQWDDERDPALGTAGTAPEFQNPLLPSDKLRPLFTPQRNAAAVVASGSGSPDAVPPKPTTEKKSRIQNTAMSMMSDPGKCLSMHQPWASLLVRGIKQHEGRSWYSSHRGRLWIAATAKEVDPDQVAALEEFYREYHPGELNFPESYPHACLLGCVDVADVVDSESYAAQYENGESQSPYVFICENPQELVMRFPVKGKHKIWKLEKDMHSSAKAGVRMVDPGGVRASLPER